MFISGALGTTIGLILMFGLLSVFCSAITEVIANLAQMRANYLLTGLRSMLDRPEPCPPAKRPDEARTKSNKAVKNELSRMTKCPDRTAEAAKKMRNAVREGATPAGEPPNMTLALFDHPLIKALQTRRTKWHRPKADGAVRNPQYISSRLFTRALIDMLLSGSHSPPSSAARPPIPDSHSPKPNGQPAPLHTPAEPLLERLHQVLAAKPMNDLPCAKAMIAMIVQAEGRLEKFEESLAHWYDEEMRRIAGWYKRWAKVILGIVGFSIAMLANIDTIQVGHGLYVNEPLRQAVVATAQAGTLCQNEDTAQARAMCANQQIAALDAAGVPIWYPPACRLGPHPAPCWAWSAGAGLHWWDFPLKLLGWAITAFAVSFGAPFWFDALSRLGSLRNAGPKPE